MKIKRNKQQGNEELYRLSRSFSALNNNHKKGVLKTAQGLLRIQRTNKEMIAAGTKPLTFFAQS